LKKRWKKEIEWRKEKERKSRRKEGCIEVGNIMKNKGNTIREGREAWWNKEKEWKGRRKEWEIRYEGRRKKACMRSDQMMNGWRNK